MSSPSSSYSQLSTNGLARPYVNNLLHVLRCANQRYSQLATSVRQSLHPTHHARKRAQALKLKVSVEKAHKLDHKYVSTIPLPVLERATSASDSPRAPSPTASVHVLRRRGPEILCVAPARFAAPIPIHPAAAAAYPQHAQIVLGSPMEISAKVVGRERELRRRSGPVSQVSQDSQAPVDMLSFNVSVFVEDLDEDPRSQSYWSSSEESASEDGCSVWYSTDSESIMVEERSRDVAFPARSQMGKNTMCLDVPADVTSHRLSWGSESSSSSGLNCGSSNSSASGLLTPASGDDMPKLTIRIKRKSCASDFTDADDESVSSEKRPKYERKEWVRASSRATSSSSSPARR